MLRPILLVALVSVPFLVALRPAPAPLAACPNAIPHEPIVLYDHSGGTLGGYVDRALTVYGDGTARLSFAFQGVPSKAEFAFPGPDAARQLALDLAQLGAGVLCDDFQVVSDLPPTTLTILRDATDSRAHTFSWYLSNGAYGAIEARLQTFTQTYFPNF